LQFGIGSRKHNFQVLYSKNDYHPKDEGNGSSPDEIAHFNFEVVEIHVDAEHDYTGKGEDFEEHESTLDCFERVALLLGLLFQSSFLVLGIVYDVEDL
jgi:hypothetical protein